MKTLKVVPTVKIVGGRILIDGLQVGHLVAVTYLNFTKKKFEEEWYGVKPILKLVEPIPENYKFNYYVLDELQIYPKHSGQGLGGLTLSAWFDTLKSPACVTVQPGHIDGAARIDQRSLENFYTRNGFSIVRAYGAPIGIAFVKVKK